MCFDRIRLTHVDEFLPYEEATFHSKAKILVLSDQFIYFLSQVVLSKKKTTKKHIGGAS